MYKNIHLTKQSEIKLKPNVWDVLETDRCCKNNNWKYLNLLIGMWKVQWNLFKPNPFTTNFCAWNRQGDYGV